MTSLDEEDRALFEETVARMAAERYDIERCRFGDMECPPAEWRAFAEQGLFALAIDRDHGGVGGGALDLAMVMRHVGGNLLPLPFLDTVIVAAALIDRLGSAAQRQSLLPRIADGTLRLSLAHREADAGDERDHVGAVTRRGLITGEKSYVFDAALADLFIVSARDEQSFLTLHLVDRHQPGIAIQTYRLPDNRLAARLTLDDVVGERLGEDAGAALDAVMDLAAVCAAAETLGAIEALNRDTFEYAKTRRQFGTTIGSFQALQHKMVDMFIAEQTAAALVADALAAVDAQARDAAAMVSAAKSYADRAGRFVGETAIQIHGGMGLTDECSVGHHLKRVLTIGGRFGSANWHVDRLGSASADREV